MSTVIAASFKRYGQIYYFRCDNGGVAPGDAILADVGEGVQFASVLFGPTERSDEQLPAPPRDFIRVAAADDEAKRAAKTERQREAETVCRTLIKEKQLEMKLVECVASLDAKHLIFFYTAETRVDFRQLVKDLASQFHARIQMQQIGVRDEAAKLGGCGICGRSLCCSTWLKPMQPVSIKMAKEQRLSLNPTKISGVCGRLMCCLRYEYEFYKEQNRRMPKLGAQVTTPDGTGTVVSTSILKNEVAVDIEEVGLRVFTPPACSATCTKRQHVVRREEVDEEADTGLDAKPAVAAHERIELTTIRKAPATAERPAGTAEPERQEHETERPKRQRRQRRHRSARGTEEQAAAAPPQPETPTPTADGEAVAGTADSAANTTRRRRRRKRRSGETPSASAEAPSAAAGDTPPPLSSPGPAASQAQLESGEAGDAPRHRRRRRHRRRAGDGGSGGEPAAS